MVQSIVLSGVAIGCIYALIGITYNVMFSASRVFSFTAGTLGMLGGVLGSLFIARLGLPVAVGFLLALAGGVVLGIVTEIVAVRPVLKSLDQHLYVLSTLALALMVQQFTAIEWGTEARPPGLPERSLRMASYALAGAIGALAGFAGGEMLLAFFGNGPMLTFYGFVPVALGGMGNNRGAVVAGLLLGLFQQTANFLVGGIFASVAVFTVFIIVLLARPEGLAGAALQRRV